MKSSKKSDYIKKKSEILKKLEKKFNSGHRNEQQQIKFSESEFSYKMLFNNMITGMAYCEMIFDTNEKPIDFIYLKINRNFAKLTGLTEDVVGKKVTETIPKIRTSNPELFYIYGRVALTGKSEEFETYVKPLKRWFSISVYSPKKQFFVAIFQNITKQKLIDKNLEESEKAALKILKDLKLEKSKVDILVRDLSKFKLAVDNVADNIIITDPEGIVIYANKAVEKVTGYRPEEAIGKKSGALWKTPMPVKYYKKLWNTIKKIKKFS